MRYHDAKTRCTRSDSKRSTRSSNRAHLLKSSLRDISRACEDAVKKASRLKRRKHLERAAKISSIPPTQEYVAMDEDEYNDEEALTICRSDPFHQDIRGIEYLVRKHITIIDEAEIELTFDISENMMQNIRKHNWSVHFGCILCKDTVQNRLQWPYNAICEVNETPVSIMNRPASKPMGRNTRDKPINITDNIQTGSNSVYFECEKENSRHFMFYVRICKLKTKKQIMDQVLANDPVDILTEFNNGIILYTIRLSLKCPISFQPILHPTRCTSCKCQTVFDLETFLDMSAISLKWICPFCSIPTSPKQLAIDTRVKSILHNTDHRGDIDLRLDSGQWIVVQD